VQLANGLYDEDRQEFGLFWCGQLSLEKKGSWPFGTTFVSSVLLSSEEISVMAEKQILEQERRGEELC